MSFLTELHCHSAPVSACADITPAEIVQKYTDAGFATVTVADHLSRVTFSPKNYSGADDWNAKIDYFLSGYRAVKEAAGERLNVLLAAELRLNRHRATDLLVYGVTEEWLRAYPDLLDTNLKTLSSRVHSAGLRLYQAHPFRNGMEICDPTLLDGYEIHNGHLGHFSRNDMAELWAARFGLPGTSGSDMHHPDSEITGGILTDSPITDNKELLRVLDAGCYTLLKSGTLCDDRKC